METPVQNDQERITQIYELMQSSSLEAGEILMQYRGKVANEEKAPDPTRDGEFQAEHIAKTIVDEMLQELFLARLYKLVQGFREKIRINVEEDTPLRFLFKGHIGSLFTVHQDPCDGTKNYIDGGTTFAAGYGISNAQNDFTHTVICAPARGEVYLASPTETRFLDLQGNELKVPEKPKINKIFQKRMISPAGEESLRKAGFSVETISGRGAHSTFVDVALGRASAALWGLSTPHDSFIPYAFAKGKGASLVNAEGRPFSGKNIQVTIEDGFPHFHKVPSVCYFAQAGEETERIRDTVLNILSETKNLHTTYLRDKDNFRLVEA